MIYNHPLVGYLSIARMHIARVAIVCTFSMCELVYSSKDLYSCCTMDLIVFLVFVCILMHNMHTYII